MEEVTKDVGLQDQTRVTLYMAKAHVAVIFYHYLSRFDL